MNSFTSFRTVNAPGVTLYQKPDQAIPCPGAILFTAAPLPPAPVSYTGLPAKDAPASEMVGSTLADVRKHADRGEWENAARYCEQLLEKDNLNSVVHFYHALVLEQMKRHTDAEQSLRRAIYLDRQSVLPHYYLGLFLQSRREPRQAARSFENALDLLQRRRDSDIVPDADGITAAELKKLAKMHLEILRERV